MEWFRRGHGEHAAHPPEPREPGDTDDSPASLREALGQLDRFVNRSAGRLPGAAVVTARRITDTLREVVDTSEVRPLDVYAALSVRGTATDYLPTTLRSYLAIDEHAAAGHAADAHGPGTRSVELLLEQLDALETSASAVLLAARQQDVDALVTQGSFLRTKFTGSDLDL